MEKVFVNGMGACDVAGSSSLYWQRTQMCAVLEQAVEQATRTGQTTPVSLVWTLPASDPLRIFQVLRELSPLDNFFWEQPAQQVALVGAGTAFHLQTQGDERFTEAARIWQALRDRAVIAYAPDITPDSTHTEQGPVLFGGFRFDPQCPGTALWQDFPDGLLILPRLLWRQQHEQATMIFSCAVQPTASLDRLVDSLCEEMAHLSARLAVLPTLPKTLSQEHCDDALRNILPATVWKDLVRRTVGVIRQGAYTKVVLAREARVLANGRPFSLPATLRQLRRSYPGAHVFAFQRGEQAFIGATPERLVHAQNGKLHTMALAGSAPRGADEEEDRRLGCELLDSQKNREEHEIVASTLRSSLSPLCSRLWIADTPELLRLKNIQHLRTAIVGELLPDRSVLEALHALHPTPAVGGAPTQAALAYIREHENLDRGWYAGPIGWADLHGDGTFAVALRSALLDERQATLFAGCGIVRDSDPEAEYAEACLKFQVILRSLSGEEERNV